MLQLRVKALLWAPVLSLGLLASGGLAGVSMADDGASVTREQPAGVHRVVWDSSQRGVKVFASDEDGDNRLRVFTQPGKGYVLNLTVSPDGRRVAFEPVAAGMHPARLIVASTMRKQAVDVLAGHSNIVGVGVIGWARSGGRLVFEGFVDEPSAGLFYPSYLFTVDTDGHNLVRHGILDSGHDNGAVYGAMLWSRAGLMYPGNGTIEFVSGPRGLDARVVVRKVQEAQPTGNGRWMFFTRYAAPGSYSLWRIRSDGTKKQRLLRPDELGPIYSFAPDHSGKRLLVTQPEHGLNGQPTGAVETVIRSARTGKLLQVIPSARDAEAASWN